MRKNINKYDIALIAAIIIINISIMIFGGNNMVEGSERIAYVYSNNELVGRYTLTENYEKEFTIEKEDGTGYNTVHIEDGKIWIHDATCPDKICLNQGKIQNGGEVIVCLPNKFMIQIKGSTENSDVDIIAK